MDDKHLRRLVAVLGVAILPAALMILYRIRQATDFASIELIAYPLLFGGAGIVAVVLAKRFYLKEPLSLMNSGGGGALSDIFWGLALTGLYFVLFFIERASLAGLLRFTPNTELLGLMLDMRQNAWMVAVWFGPVLWIGIALYEELVRAFLLCEMWAMVNRPWWIATVIVVAAAIIGLTHWSQGPYGIVTIFTKSIVTGVFYYYRRRLLPLVVAHALYDGLQVAALLLTYPSQPDG